MVRLIRRLMIRIIFLIINLLSFLSRISASKWIKLQNRQNLNLNLKEFDTNYLNSKNQLDSQLKSIDKLQNCSFGHSNKSNDSSDDYIECHELICLNKDTDTNNNHHIRLDNLGNLVDLSKPIDCEECCCCCESDPVEFDQLSDQSDQFEDDQIDCGKERNEMSTTTENSSTGTNSKTKPSPQTKLKPVATKRSSLDANTVPARKNTSGVYKLINPKRTSLDNTTTCSVAANKVLGHSNDTSSPSSMNTTNKSSLLSTPSFDTYEKPSTTSSKSSNDHLTTSTNASSNTSTAVNVSARKLSMDKKSLNGITEEELNCAFQLLDVNSDGSISKEELKEMLLSLNIQADDYLIDQMIVDVTRSDNKDQFKELMINFAKNKDKEDDIDRDLYAAFQVFDRDQNGYLSKDELQLALEMMGEEFTEKDINTLMRLTDLDNDGKISFNEFKIKFRTLI